MNFLKKVGKVAMWFFILIFAAFAILVVVRMFHFSNLKKTNEQVAKIHATKLTMDDVVGKNLPPDPGAEADKTVAGIDANKNGIRDDVELAIFKEYPKSAKTRAVLLQYALALQMEAVQTIVNKETVTAVAEETSRGFDCVGSIVKRGEGDFERLNTLLDFVKNKQINTEQRKKGQKDFYKGKLGSYELPSGCDINLNLLEN